MNNRTSLLTALAVVSFNITALAIDTGANPWYEQPPYDNYPFPKPNPPADKNPIDVPEIDVGAAALGAGALAGIVLVYQEQRRNR